jgi:hypothetical protein
METASVGDLVIIMRGRRGCRQIKPRPALNGGRGFRKRLWSGNVIAPRVEFPTPIDCPKFQCRVSGQHLAAAYLRRGVERAPCAARQTAPAVRFSSTYASTNGSTYTPTYCTDTPYVDPAGEFCRKFNVMRSRLVQITAATGYCCWLFCLLFQHALGPWRG